VVFLGHGVSQVRRPPASRRGQRRAGSLASPAQPSGCRWHRWSGDAWFRSFHVPLGSGRSLGPHPRAHEPSDIQGPFCPDARSIQGTSFPFDPAGVVQFLEQGSMEFLPDTEVMPFLETTPTRHAAAASRLSGQIRPANASLQHEQDPTQSILIGHRRTPPLWLRRWRRQKRAIRSQSSEGRISRAIQVHYAP
jgi:hypothetical protein